MSKGIKKAALALCIFAFILSALPAPNLAAEPASQTVRVKLSTNNATAIAVSVKGKYFIKECGLLLPSGTLTLRSNFNGTISAVHSTYGELYSGDTISLMRTDMQPSAGYLSFNSRRYLGHLYARALSSGYIQLVNEVPVAHYLYGVVAYEMNNLYPLDALKAQAIAAKSYVLSIIAEKPNASYHIGDTSADQVYKGYNSSYTNVIEAVDSTISEVLTVNGRILTAYYSASNGGETGSRPGCTLRYRQFTKPEGNRYNPHKQPRANIAAALRYAHSQAYAVPRRAGAGAEHDTQR